MKNAQVAMTATIGFADGSANVVLLPEHGGERRSGVGLDRCR